MIYQDYKQYTRNPYSESELQTIKSYWGKLPAKEIALITGRSIFSVRNKAKAMGLAKFRHFNKEQTEFIRINASKLSAEEIGNFIGRSKTSVIYKAKHSGIRLTKTGKDNPSSKLTDQDIDYIRELREDYGLTLKNIADKFEVHEGTISKICSYKTR